MKNFYDFVMDANGNALHNASIVVKDYLTGSNATIYSDNGLTQIVTATVATDVAGYYNFYVADGKYTLTISYNATFFKTLSPVDIFDPTSQTTFTDTGAADAYAISNNNLELALRTGLRVRLKIAHDNTGACTLAYNGLTAKSIKTQAGANPGAAALKTGGIYSFEYDGTNWQIA